MSLTLRVGCCSGADLRWVCYDLWLGFTVGCGCAIWWGWVVLLDFVGVGVTALDLWFVGL